MCAPWLSVFPCHQQVGPRFEVVVFTASLAKYADPLLDLMDKVCAVAGAGVCEAWKMRGVGQLSCPGQQPLA
jgi:hypothetical protein